MPPRERGRTPAGFREQLLQHLRNGAARDGILVQRVQQRIAFERLIARLPLNGEWVLKGGLAMLFRYGLQTRPTKDIDLRTPRDVTETVDRLRQAVAAARVDDNFSFEFGEVAQEMQGAPGGSRRIRVVARVAGRDFATFHADLSSGDALVDQPDITPRVGYPSVRGDRSGSIPCVPCRAAPRGEAPRLHASPCPGEYTGQGPGRSGHYRRH